VLFGKPGAGVGDVEAEETVEEIGMVFGQLVGEFEEGFGGVGEEFDGAVGGVVGEECVVAGAEVVADLVALFIEDVEPVGTVVAVGQWRHAVIFAVEPVEMVGKFVEDDVEAVVGVAAASEDLVPGETDFALFEMLAGDGDAFFDEFRAAEGMDHADFGCVVVNEDCADAIEVVAVAVEDEEGGLGSDRDDDFVGDFEVADAVKGAFGGDDFGDFEEALLLG